MAPLKHIEKDYPVIDANFQNFCASHGIFSVEDFLIHDFCALTAFAEQQPTSERLKEGISQVLTIIDAQHQPWLNGLELLEDSQKNKGVLSTGHEGIDLFLQGGFREGQVTELVGPSSSGKTQVCLQAAASLAKMHFGSVLFLDTGNSFSPKRIAYFVGRASDHSANQANHRILQTLMGRISCHSVFDIFAMFDVLYQLDLELRSQMGKKDNEHRVRLLIVDSVSSLITPILGGRGSQGRALMVFAGFLLKKLANEYNLAVLVTNHTVGGEGGHSKPALGESWKSIPHVRLLLSRDREHDVCSISILKHTSMASGLSGNTANVIQNNNNNNNGFGQVNGGTQLPAGTSLQNLMFGTLTVLDDELTEGHELGSGLVGKAQGFYVASSEDGSSQTMAFTAMFESGGYVDSISFFGVHRTAVSESQIAVMGGTGKYVNAKGFATVKTFSVGNQQHETDGAETLLQFIVYLTY